MTNLYYTEETLTKVYDALERAGLSQEKIVNTISDMQNNGLYFREAEKINPPKRGNMPTTAIQPAKFVRKPFYVDGVRVSEKNMEAVAQWCQGEVQTTTRKGKTEPIKYISVRVFRPQNPRQTMAFVGDWILYNDKGGFKVYTQSVFMRDFESTIQEDDNYGEIIALGLDLPEEQRKNLDSVLDEMKTASDADREKLQQKFNEAVSPVFSDAVTS